MLRSAESDYGSLGAWDWLMDLNFLLRSFLSLAVVAALLPIARTRPRLRIGLALLAVWAVTSGLLAFFPDDPAGTPIQPAGRVHVALAAVAFLAVAVGARLSARGLRRDPAWAPAIVPLAVLSYGAFVPALLLGRTHLRAHSLGGLFEKLFRAVELAWLGAAAAWVVLQAERTAPAPSAPVATTEAT